MVAVAAAVDGRRRRRRRQWRRCGGGGGGGAAAAVESEFDDGSERRDVCHLPREHPADAGRDGERLRAPLLPVPLP